MVPDWSACILAGGRGRRLAGRIKPLMTVAGRTILARQVDALAAAGVRPWLVAADPAPFAGTGLLVVPDAVAAGVGGLMLFAVPAERDALGSAATDPGGALNVMIRDVVSEVGTDTVVMTDLCLDEFTDHGHCGVLAADGSVDNDATLLRYADMALAHATAGAHIVGTSGMMDGQVAAVRVALDGSGHDDIAVLAYAAKYASAFYGPFREAVDSQLAGDRRTYQQDPANAGEALREVALDVAEGADIVMVKPAGPYLDIVRRVADSIGATGIPVAAYQVSGEYAMVEAAAAHGWIDREAAILESLTSIRRAGAGIVLTYWATEAARLLTTTPGSPP